MEGHPGIHGAGHRLLRGRSQRHRRHRPGEHLRPPRMTLLLVTIIFLALLFDFVNGMNDAANSVATIVATRVLTPRVAVAWAAFFNFAAAFLFGVHVAKTIGQGIVDTAIVTPAMILATLLGAIIWSYACTHMGFPISVSHSLVGGLVGTALLKSGPGALIASGLLKVFLFIFLAPLMGMVLGYFIMILVYCIVRRQPLRTVDRWVRRLQLVSAPAYSLGHGTNDPPKTIG